MGLPRPFDPEAFEKEREFYAGMPKRGRWESDSEYDSRLVVYMFRWKEKLRREHQQKEEARRDAEHINWGLAE